MKKFILGLMVMVAIMLLSVEAADTMVNVACYVGAIVLILETAHLWHIWNIDGDRRISKFLNED